MQVRIYFNLEKCEVYAFREVPAAEPLEVEEELKNSDYQVEQFEDLEQASTWADTNLAEGLGNELFGLWIWEKDPSHEEVARFLHDFLGVRKYGPFADLDTPAKFMPFADFTRRDVMNQMRYQEKEKVQPVYDEVRRIKAQVLLGGQLANLDSLAKALLQQLEKLGIKQHITFREIVGSDIVLLDIPEASPIMQGMKGTFEPKVKKRKDLKPEKTGKK